MPVTVQDIHVMGEPNLHTSAYGAQLLYGVDVSAYQPNFDFAACRREGFDFAFIKSTEGTTWRSAYFHDQLARARAAGLLVAAYHYVRGDDVAGQLRNILGVVSRDVPVILDVEYGAGSITSVRALVDALNDAGYRTPLVYIPLWYWRDHMGSPDLRGLPPNWHSRYPDNVVRRKESFVLGDEYWPMFGGLSTLIAQFTSALAVANYPNGRIDGNAYRGTRDELSALLNGDDVGLTAEEHAWLEDAMRRTQQMHMNSFLSFDPITNPPPHWSAGGNLSFLDEKLNEALQRALKPVLTALTELTDDEVNIITAVRAQPTGGQVAVPELAQALSGLLGDDIAAALGRRLLGLNDSTSSVEDGAP